MNPTDFLQGEGASDLMCNYGLGLRPGERPGHGQSIDIIYDDQSQPEVLEVY